MPTTTSTPTKVVLKAECYSETPVAGYVEYVFYVNGQEYRELPIDANVREPVPSKSKPYGEMIRTLDESPEKFLENNLGISVIATEINKLANNEFALTFKSGTGILNGGHTQRAILDSQSNPNISNALVRLIVRVRDYSDARIAEIAAAQNSTTSVKAISLAEKKGLFRPIKIALPQEIEKHIIWYEGRSVPNNAGIEANNLITLLNLFNVIRYESDFSQSKGQPTTSASSNSSVFSFWEKDPSTFVPLYPLLEDMLALEEYMSCKFHEKTGMARFNVIKENKRHVKMPISGREPAYILPKQFKYPVLSAYRANIHFDKGTNTIGWREEPMSLFDRTYLDLFETLKEHFKLSNNINQVGKHVGLYRLLFMQVNSVVRKDPPFKTLEY